MFIFLNIIPSYCVLYKFIENSVYLFFCNLKVLSINLRATTLNLNRLIQKVGIKDEKLNFFFLNAFSFKPISKEKVNFWPKYFLSLQMEIRLPNDIDTLNSCNWSSIYRLVLSSIQIKIFELRAKKYSTAFIKK